MKNKELEKIIKDCEGLSKPKIEEKIYLLKELPIQTKEVKETIQKLQQMM